MPLFVACRLLWNLWIFAQIFAFNFPPNIAYHPAKMCFRWKGEVEVGYRISELPLSHWLWQLHVHRPKSSSVVSNNWAQLRLRLVEVKGPLWASHQPTFPLAYTRKPQAGAILLLKQCLTTWVMSYKCLCVWVCLCFLVYYKCLL